MSHAIGVKCIPRYPLLLGIQGPPGDGKSFQSQVVLERHGFAVFRLSSALLSGGYEGDPITVLRDLYQQAADFYTDDREKFPAILLEDFDLSPASGRADVS